MTQRSIKVCHGALWKGGIVYEDLVDPELQQLQKSAQLDSDVGQNLEMPAMRELCYLSNHHPQCQFQVCVFPPKFWECPLLLLLPSF